MGEEMKAQEQATKCGLCGRTSDQVTLLRAEQKGQPMWVCVQCLPMLIHGAH